MYNKLKLWFFLDLTDYQRRQLFSVFGMPVDEIGYNHGKQEVALRHAVRSLITAKPDTTPPAPQMRVVGWIYEDDLPTNYPYDAMFDHSKVDGVRMFPVFAPDNTSCGRAMENSHEA